jgi:hypothetical protein
VRAAKHRLEKRERDRAVVNNEQAQRAIGVRRKLPWTWPRSIS